MLQTVSASGHRFIFSCDMLPAKVVERIGGARVSESAKPAGFVAGVADVGKITIMPTLPPGLIGKVDLVYGNFAVFRRFWFWEGAELKYDFIV